MVTSEIVAFDAQYKEFFISSKIVFFYQILSLLYLKSFHQDVMSSSTQGK